MSTELSVVAPPQPEGVLQVIARAASDPSVDVGKMEALLNMQERLMKMSAEQQFNAALVELQSKVSRVSKEGRILNRAGGVQSSYARYEDVDKMLRPLMDEHGFAISFENHDSGAGLMKFTAELRHRAGHSKAYHISLPMDKSGAKSETQGAGSTSMYARRYLLLGIFNIVTEGADTDGSKIEYITDDQRMNIETIIYDKKIQLNKVLNWLRVERLHDIPAGRYEEVVAALNKRQP